MDDRSPRHMNPESYKKGTFESSKLEKYTRFVVWVHYEA